MATTVKSFFQHFSFVCIVLLIGSCDSSIKLQNKTAHDGTLFTRLKAEQTNIDFNNKIEETLYFNFINYPYMFNGGGVSAGDINNDGLVDLYFTSNQGSNKLYLNKGNLEFEDITKSAGVEDKTGWSTGTTMVDLNGDGYLDIYVSKSGSLENEDLRENLLYINQRDLTFKEKGKAYGLNDSRMGTQAYFFDYDKDGDLDAYILNHPDFAPGNTDLDLSKPYQITAGNSDHFYRNEGDGFRNVTVASGFGNFGFGLSASIGDFNNDGWEDIYICNDFLQPDQLYINNQDGTFSNKINTQLDHISQNSMGSDLADINNDGLMDLVVMEMSPEDHIRSKANMPSMSTEKFENLVEIGFHHQYMINTLQWNRGNGNFSEIAQLSGISKTDWSWAPLFADFDEDGWNDLFITNGILKDLANSDFRKKIKSRITNKQKMSLEEAQAMIPSNPLGNYIFQNKKDLSFKKKSKEWGLKELSFSNGSTYADLDNDGDLDLVVNNVDDQAFVYRNNSVNKSLIVKLEGPKGNSSGIGSKVEVFNKGSNQCKFQYQSRGYLSSVADVLHFGLGSSKQVDSVTVTWPDMRQSTLINPSLEKINVLKYKNSYNSFNQEKDQKAALAKINPEQLGIDFIHKEVPYNDYNDQLLLPHKLSQLGPFVAAGDVNDDGLDDFYVGGSAGVSGALYLLTESGFQLREGPWNDQKDKEDLQSVFFDYDNDKDLDLYVVSGSYEFGSDSKKFKDRLYENDGQGNFKTTSGVLPDISINGCSVKVSDIDLDGDLDIFIGGRVLPGKYPLAPSSHILENVGRKFEVATRKRAPELSNAGMVTDAVFTDFDLDGDEDLLVVGEWSSIQLFVNDQGIFKKGNLPSLESTVGLWFAVEAHDVDADGDEDYFIGNLGLNSKFKTGHGKEFHIYADDFDQSGNYDIVLSNKYQDNLVPVRGLECSSEQIPMIKTKFASFESFATANMIEIYGEQKLKNAHHKKVDLLESILLKNNGNGEFEVIALPNEAQISAIKDFAFIDIDGNGLNEILAVGNLYEAEVETVRYDASKGVVMSFQDNKFKIIDSKISGFINSGNARDLNIINCNDKQYLIVTNNDDKPSLFSL